LCAEETLSKTKNHFMDGQQTDLQNYHLQRIKEGQSSHQDSNQGKGFQKQKCPLFILEGRSRLSPKRTMCSPFFILKSGRRDIREFQGRINRKRMWQIECVHSGSL
jgi:hypothetical protein